MSDRSDVATFLSINAERPRYIPVLGRIPYTNSARTLAFSSRVGGDVLAKINIQPKSLKVGRGTVQSSIVRSRVNVRKESWCAEDSIRSRDGSYTAFAGQRRHRGAGISAVP